MTKWFLAYLSEYRSDMVRHAQEQWLSGQIELTTEHGLKERINVLGEIDTLEFGAIAAFYEQIDSENQSQSVSEEDAE